MCCKCFSTVTDEKLLYFTSLYFNQDIPALRTWLISSVLLPEAPQAIHLISAVYHLISQKPTLNFKSGGSTNGLRLSTTNCKACVVDLVATALYTSINTILFWHLIWMHAKTSPESSIASIELTALWIKFFRNVAFHRFRFRSCSISAAWESLLESVQLELTESTDVRYMDPETLQKLTGLIVAHYTYLNPAIAAALEDFVCAKTSFLPSGGGIVFSLFILQFPLFPRQACIFCPAPGCNFRDTPGLLVHGRDNIAPNFDSFFRMMTREEVTALRVLAKEAQVKSEATAPLTFSAEV